jgi:hypothetical protein
MDEKTGNSFPYSATSLRTKVLPQTPQTKKTGTFLSPSYLIGKSQEDQELPPMPTHSVGMSLERRKSQCLLPSFNSEERGERQAVRMEGSEALASDLFGTELSKINF